MTVQAYKIPSLFEVRFTDQPGGCERPHTHPSLIISAVSEGALSLQVDAAEVCLHRGTLAAVGPYVLHCVRSYSPDFAGVYVLELFGLPDGCNGFTASHFQIFGSQLLHGKEHADDFLNLCESLLGGATEPEKIEACAGWLQALFSMRFSGYPFRIQENPECSPLAARIKKILDADNGESPAYDEIAQACGCSREHCNRVFRQAYNLSIQAYFLNKKAAMARILLDSGRSLSEVAFLCGFYDQSHFTRVFKEIYQVSPRKYREAVMADHSHTRKHSRERI